MVFVPEFLPKFSMSLDYYNIRIKDVIGTALPGDLINACFGTITAASASDPDCLVIRRNPITGGLDGDPATTQGLFGVTTNLGELFTDGFDLIANYRTSVGFGDLALSFVGNYTRNSEFNANVASEDSFFRECAGHYSVNCSFTGSIQPKLQFSQRTTLTMGKVDLSLLWRWIDKMEFEPRQLADDLAAAIAAGTIPRPAAPTRKAKTQRMHGRSGIPHNPCGALLRPDGAVQRDRQYDLHLHRPEPAGQPAEGGRQHDRFDHVQQRQRLSVDLRRSGTPLRGQCQAVNFRASPSKARSERSGRAEMPASFLFNRPMMRAESTGNIAMRFVDIFDVASPAGWKVCRPPS